MFGNLFIMVIQYLMEIYIILKLITDYNKKRLLVVMFAINYHIFGFIASIYIASLCTLSIYDNYIPIIAKLMCSKINPTYTIRIIINYCDTYKITNCCAWILAIGDMTKELFETCAIKLLSKTSTNSPETTTEKLDDYMIDNSEILQLNQELDKLLNMGSTIISQTLSGKKNEQVENANTFMSSFINLLGTNKTT